MAPEAKIATVIDRENWPTPPEQIIPHPTYSPAGLALGVAFVLFGIATSYWFCAAGVLLMGIALKSWIGGMANGE
jgi:hypothetical protein